MPSVRCYGYLKDHHILKLIKKKNHFYSILVIRIKENKASLSHPCSKCAIAFESSPVPFVIYSINEIEFAIISNIGISRHHISSSQRKISI